MIHGETHVGPVQLWNDGLGSHTQPPSRVVEVIGTVHEGPLSSGEDGIRQHVCPFV